MTPEQRDKLAGIYWGIRQKSALTMADSPEAQLARLNMLSEAVAVMIELQLAEYVDGPVPKETEH